MTFLLTKITFIAYLIWALPSLAINNGEKAIAFSLFSHTNEQINLENFKGKTIDSILSTDQDDIPKAENYLLKAIEDLANNRSVKIAKTKPYGCSVKY